MIQLIGHAVMSLSFTQPPVIRGLVSSLGVFRAGIRDMVSSLGVLQVGIRDANFLRGGGLRNPLRPRVCHLPLSSVGKGPPLPPSLV